MKILITIQGGMVQTVEMSGLHFVATPNPAQTMGVYVYIADLDTLEMGDGHCAFCDEDIDPDECPTGVCRGCSYNMNDMEVVYSG